VVKESAVRDVDDVIRPKLSQSKLTGSKSSNLVTIIQKPVTTVFTPPPQPQPEPPKPILTPPVPVAPTYERYSPPATDNTPVPVAPTYERYSPPATDNTPVPVAPTNERYSPPAPQETDMGNVLSKLKDFVSDVGKTIAYSVAAPVNSVTGHKYKPEYSTKVGSVLGQGSNVGIDSLHIAGKSFADTITGGAATKLANKVRSDENKESAFNYNEMKNLHSVNTGVKAIDKGFNTFEQVSKKGAVILGAAAGAKALGGAVDKIGDKSPEELATKEDKPAVSTMGGLGIAALAIGGALLLR